VFRFLAIAAVLSNWHNVLRAINMASGERSLPSYYRSLWSRHSFAPAKLPKPKEEDDADSKLAQEAPLPQTLVRIPTQHAPALIAQSTSGSIAD
jgi:DASH complex subunit DAD2